MTICIRGAVTAKNSKDNILAKTKELLIEIIEENNLNIEDITAIFFTATKDLDKVYPAVSARAIGITDAALMCFQEMYVEGSMEKCIRVTVMTESDKKQKDAKHIFLGEAQKLRPDLKR
ncbi:Chorismate mutase AroH [bioreactor metagenome]|uniref:Chorismate mutase AroH n=1 Tax=bioreactor metagenome TaxID=1076179 RepID=A0A645BPA8_9ZZZZ|nr:chorismate mutase [Lachnospiraceae bacterium]